MTAPNFDIEHLRTRIGGEEAAAEVLSAVLVARLNAMLDRKGPGGNEPHILPLFRPHPIPPTAC